ncbi:MAG: NACHT domain-containing protein [Calditrichia bacterium]
MAIELLTAKGLEAVANGVITTILYDSAKYGLGTLSGDVEKAFEAAIKDCTTELEPETRKALRTLFKSKRVQTTIDEFQYQGKIIEADFFVGIATPVLGENFAKSFIPDLFNALRNHFAGNPKLAHRLELIYLENHYENFSRFVKESGERDAKTQEMLETMLQLLKELVKKQDSAFSANYTIGYTEIPPLPKDFVKPETAFTNVSERFQRKNVVLVYGIAGSGKSVIATSFAKDVEATGKNIFWFRFEARYADEKTLENALLGFLHDVSKRSTNDLRILLKNTNALLVLDDLHYVKDEKLQQFINMIASLVNELADDQTRLLLTARSLTDFLNRGIYATVPVAGLSDSEARNLLLNQWRLDLPGKTIARVIQIMGGNPQFLLFFREWFELSQPNEKVLENYLNHADRLDDGLQVYLINELYAALGNAESPENKLG